MIYSTTHKETEDRRLLLDLLGDSINVAQVVRQQPAMTKAQREAVQWLLMAAMKVRREFTRATTEAVA